MVYIDSLMVIWIRFTTPGVEMDLQSPMFAAIIP